MEDPSFERSFVIHPPFLWSLQLVGVLCWIDNSPLFQFSGSELLKMFSWIRIYQRQLYCSICDKKKLVALNNLARFSMNVFIFGTSNGYANTANECMHVWDYVCKMQWNTHFQTLLEWDHFHWFQTSIYIRCWTKVLGLDTMILSRIKKELHGHLKIGRASCRERVFKDV